jgi:hypothetical protein
MTSETPLTGKDTKAAFTGLIIGAIALAIVVLTIVNLTNRSFDAHEATPAAQPH